MRGNQSGSTLVEVLVATMILAVTGISITGSLLVSRKTTDSLAYKGAALRDLALISQQVAMQPFIACPASAAPSPYATPAVPSGSRLESVTVTVAVADPSGAIGTMQGCTGSASSQTQPMQVVTVSATYRGQQLSKSIMKVRP